VVGSRLGGSLVAVTSDFHFQDLGFLGQISAEQCAAEFAAGEAAGVVGGEGVHFDAAAVGEADQEFTFGFQFSSHSARRWR
jgi:hypothetical protein